MPSSLSSRPACSKVGEGTSQVSSPVGRRSPTRSAFAISFGSSGLPKMPSSPAASTASGCSLPNGSRTVC